MSTLDLEVQGMGCRSCVKHVTQALQTIAGVSGVEVDLQSGHVRVSGEFPKGSEPLITALASADYPAQLATSSVSLGVPKTSVCSSTRGGRGGCCCG
jgi:copper chaperone